MAMGLRWGLPADLEKVNEFLHKTEPITAFLGYRLVELSEGMACAVFDALSNAQRVGGILHGGAIMTALDETMGFAALTLNDGDDQVTLELKVNFLEPGVKPPFKVCGQVVRRGGRVVVVEGEVRDADGRVIAKALGTWYYLRRRVEG
ncbi:PaaI family thioesterase [Pyrobaculum aerophilum]|uniref:PaaI family thioesterase n=1 Tax=Pyrobaculum aerophilum TaxID=13773 RepID=UPI002FDA7EE7